MTPTIARPTLALTTLEDRLTPADVVVNYFVFTSNAGTGVATTTGTTGFNNSGFTTTGVANTGVGLGSTGFTGLNTTNLGTTGLGTGTATNLTTTNLLGTNTLGSTGLGVGSATGLSTSNTGLVSTTSGTNALGTSNNGTTTGTGTIGFGTNSPNTNSFGTIGTSTTGTNTGTGFGTGLGNGAPFTTGLNTRGGVTGIGTGNAFTNTGTGTNQLVGSSGFAFDGTNGITIITTILPNGTVQTSSGTLNSLGLGGLNGLGGTLTNTGVAGTTPAGTGTTTTGGGTLGTTSGTTVGGATTTTTPSAAQVEAARAERRAVFNEDGTVGVLLNPFPGYAGELRTAVADVTGDGVPDTVVAPGIGGGPRVAVFDGRTGAVVADFFAYDDALRNGVTVGAGDLDGDGRAEVVTGAGPGGGPRVRAFTIDGGRATRTADFFAFEEAFRGGVTVAVGDANGDGRADILTGAGEGGGPRVDVFTPTGNNLRTLFVGDANGRGGAQVGGVLTSAGRTLLAVGGPTAGLFDATTGDAVSTLSDGRDGPVTVSVVRDDLVRLTRAGADDRLFDVSGVEVG